MLRMDASLLIDENCRKYTDFITEWGVYQYKRGPQGYYGTVDADFMT